MQQRARYFVSAVGLLLSLSGCPVTDDYFLLDDGKGGEGGETSQAGSGSGHGGSKAGTSSGGAVDQAGSTTQAGSTEGGSPSAGTGTTGGSTAALGGMPGEGGGPSSGDAGAPGGAGGQPCVPSTERCNGRDDDCNESIDEFVCLSNCSGFVLATDPDHGYMLCNGARKAGWDTARRACEDQDMRLAWLTSAAENMAVAQRLDSLGTDIEVLFGATDQGSEGNWVWMGGAQFWSGDEDGNPVGGVYNNWSDGTPNNNNNEDCALLNVMTGSWSDRTCNATYAYVCEQPD